MARKYKPRPSLDELIAAGRPVSARNTALALGISAKALLERMHNGEIEPVIHSGRLIRFDLEKVKKQLNEPVKIDPKLRY